MRGLGFLRARTKIVLGLVNVLVLAAALQIAGVRVAGEAGRIARSGVATADEIAGILALRLAAEPSPRAVRPSRGAVDALPPHAQASPSLPIAGKGLWIWLFKQVEGGDPVRIVRKARALGLTHLYVRSSSTRSGLTFLGDVDRILPVAHAAGIKIVAWDFPTLENPEADVRRLMTVLDHRGPGGHRVDGIAADVETPAEGVQLTAQKARYFARRLQQMRPYRFRVLVPPKATSWTKSFYPYDIIRHFDAVAPMVYWVNRDPIATLRETMSYLARFNKPIAPIGQAYDPGVDKSGPPGAPPGFVLGRFATDARNHGAVGVSFWSWQHATRDQLRAISEIPYPVPVATPAVQ